MADECSEPGCRATGDEVMKREVRAGREALLCAGCAMERRRLRDPRIEELRAR